MKKPRTYKDAGVDIDKAEKALSSVKASIAATYNDRVLSGIGLFGSFYDISTLEINKPVLVSSTDGVGTKLKVAVLSGKHRTVGQDLVNHCINDIAVCGARPLYFLDYFASGILDPQVYHEVMSGLAFGCKTAEIPLIGGETAEMPDFYAMGDYDMCGTITGIVERDNIIDGSKIDRGDILVGVGGNGLHTNGYTLARHVLLESFALDQHIDKLGHTLTDELLRIHPNYFPFIQEVRQLVSPHGMAHITGGGIEGNTRRLLHADFTLEIDWKSWPQPPIFDLIRVTGDVPEEDMRRTFNLGIGLVLIVNPQDAKKLLDSQRVAGFPLYQIGKVT